MIYRNSQSTKAQLNPLGIEPKATEGPDLETQAQAACRGVLAAYSADPIVVEDSAQRIPDQTARQSEAAERRAAALADFQRCPSTCAADVRAKLEVLFALEGWMGEEDPEIWHFALLIAREAYPFLSGDPGRPSPRRSFDRHPYAVLKPLLSRLPKLF